jgi:hypothetical protein
MSEFGFFYCLGSYKSIRVWITKIEFCNQRLVPRGHKPIRQEGLLAGSSFARAYVLWEVDASVVFR